MHLYIGKSLNMRQFIVGVSLIMAMIGVILGTLPYYFGDRWDGKKVFLDLNYLIANRFTIDLRHLSTLVPEAYLYREKVLKNAISCQFSCHERTRFTQCSCDALCEQAGDCCFDYWSHCKTKNETFLVDEKKLDKQIDVINKTKSKYAACGMLSTDSEDVSIKLISVCLNETSLLRHASLQEELKGLSDQLKHSLRSSTRKYSSIYEQLCVSNEIQIVGFDDAQKLLYMAYDITTNLFYKNYFCARCNDISDRDIKIIQPKIKCPLEFDIELKRKNLTTNFETIRPDNSPCVFTFIKPNDEIGYRKCNAEKYLVGSILDFNSYSLFFNATTSIFQTQNIEHQKTAKDIAHERTLEKYYKSLCDLYLLPVNVNISSSVFKIEKQFDFRNLFCLKGWLIHCGLDPTRLEEISQIDGKHSKWIYQSVNYTLSIGNFDVFSIGHKDLNNELHEIQDDIRDLEVQYTTLSEQIRTTPVIPYDRSSIRKSRDKVVEVLNQTSLHSEDALMQYVQHERRLSHLTTPLAFNFTIRISLLFSTKLNSLASESKFNLNDLNDEEKLFVYKTIIAEKYIDKLIERYDLRKLMIGDYIVNLGYLPSSSSAEFRYAAEIYIMFQLIDSNLVSLSDRLEAVLKMMNTFFRRDLKFFKTYVDTSVKEIELLNFIPNGINYAQYVHYSSTFCIDKDLEIHQSDEFSVDYESFIKNNLMAYVQIGNREMDEDHLRTKHNLFVLTQIPLSVFNETKYLSEYNYYRFSIMFDNMLFKMHRKLLVRYCHVKSSYSTIFLPAHNHFKCKSTDLDLVLIKDLDDKNVNMSVANGLINIHRIDVNYTVGVNEYDAIIIGDRRLLTCIDKNSYNLTQILKLNSHASFSFWIGEDEVEEIMENIITLTNWESIFWTVLTGIVAILLTYMNIKF